MLSRFCPTRFGVLSVVWCSAADIHLKLLDRVVSDASFLTRGVFECGTTHRRSVAVLSMLYEIRYNLMRPLYGVLPAPHVPVRVTRGALVAHRFTYLILAVKRYTIAGPLFTSQYYCGTILLILYLIVWDWRVSRAWLMFYYLPELLYPILSSTIFSLLFFLSIGWYCEAGVFGLIGYRSLSLSLALPTSFNNNNNNNNNNINSMSCYVLVFIGFINTFVNHYALLFIGWSYCHIN